MKTLIITLTVLLIASQALAAPFLVCDPYPPEAQITAFIGVLDGKPFQTPYSLHSSGAAIVFDIGTLDDGPHTFTEITAANPRGQSDPVPFVLPAVPSSPSHTRISP